MRAADGCVELELSLRYVAGRALVVADLRTRGMSFASREIHSVMTGAARCARRPCQVSHRLGRAGVLLMAGFATADVRRVYHARPIEHRSAEAYDSVRTARLNARQFSAGVDLVDHHRQVDRVPGIGIGGLWRVAKHAHFHAAPRPAVRRDLVVAFVAALRSDHIANRCNLPAAGNEIEGRADVVRPELELLRLRDP